MRCLIHIHSGLISRLADVEFTGEIIYSWRSRFDRGRLWIYQWAIIVSLRVKHGWELKQKDL